MPEKIETIALHDTARERYLNYALSVITSRALPDIRDGFKPVQRRILYAMYANLRLTHDAKFRKSAAVVGEVMAKYHPHGDQAIYDAMTRLAQPFSLRYPLVDGHGNFGSLDGDSPAAMRYTEARLQAISSSMVEEITRDTVDFRANYDGQFEEPVVLPAQLPNLLLNGATGIAVGFATNIPPHNLREIAKGCLHMVEHPEASVADLMRFVKGPDFPTGGKLLNTAEEIASIYETGRGPIRLAGETTLEREGRKRLLIITSIPYALNKATLVEKIADHIRAGKLPQIQDIRDESTDEVRIVCELSSNANPEAAIAYLYKHTPLESKFHVNLTCLVPGDGDGALAPAQVGLVDMIRHFLDFRFEVVTKRIEYDLLQLLKRIHILEGFEIVFAGLDEAIAIIRASESKADAATKLMAHFGIDEVQVNAVLEMRLYRLARLEIDTIIAELNDKRAKAAALRELLDSDERLWQLVTNELKALVKRYGDRRRTQISGPVEVAQSFGEEHYIVSEDTFVMATREGWFKRQRSYSDVSAIRVRDIDEVGWIVQARTREVVIFFTSIGRAYSMRVDKVPATSGYGEPLQAHFDFADGERLVGVATTDLRVQKTVTEEMLATLGAGAPAPPYFIALSRAGAATRFAQEPYEEPSHASGRRFMRLSTKTKDGLPDAVVRVLPTDGTEAVCVASGGGRALVFGVDQVPLLRNPGRGVGALKLEEGDAILSFALATKSNEGLEVETNRGRKERVTPRRYTIGRRNNRGRLVIRRGNFTGVFQSTTELLAGSDEVGDEPQDDVDLAPEAEGVVSLESSGTKPALGQPDSSDIAEEGDADEVPGPDDGTQVSLFDSDILE